MPKPLIGITTERWSSSLKAPNSRVQGQVSGYIDAVQAAGGLPLLIPLSLPLDDLAQLYALVDGVIIPGGGDIDPAHYATPTHPATNSIDADRDRMELYLTRQALAEDKPWLGVCRGIQVLAVAAGGSLYQDLPSEYGGALEHYFHHPEYPLEHLAHSVNVEAGSLLARTLGQSTLRVNSRHHQAARDPGPGLQVAARAPDGVIEAIERPGSRFALGVQWHPENLQAQPEMRALFAAFVAAARRD